MPVCGPPLAIQARIACSPHALAPTCLTPSPPGCALQEDERRAVRRRGRGRIRELEAIKNELAEKELVLLGKERELEAREQSLAVLREELEIERKLRALVGKQKEKAEEEAALARGLCSGGSMLP